MLDRSPLVLVAVPGQLMLLTGGVVTYPAGFGRASVWILVLAFVSLVALGAAVRPLPAGRVLSGAALAANLVLLGVVGWQAATHLSTLAAALALVLALVSVGPTVMVLATSLRRDIAR